MSLKKIIFLNTIFVTVSLFCPLQAVVERPCTIILDPAGDARHAGRSIGDVFERGLTLQIAEKLKEFIEERVSHVKVLITRMPGDTVYELQNASLSNRMHADLFINLNCYHTQETKPTLYLYQFSYGNDFVQYQQGLALQSYDQACCINKQVTDSIMQSFKTILSEKKYQSLFTVAIPCSIPLKPLIGVIAPAVSLEMGLKSKELWHCYCEPLVNAVIKVIDELG